jgi:AcrR family transcriptional regulator
MRKGEQTRVAILDAALDLASRDGLEGLTIGLLAERMQMSKSGVFAHFGSREDLQVEVVREYHRRFEDEVFFPSLREPRGLPRLRAMISRWIEKRIQEVTTGCIYISGAVEYDDRADSQVREQLASSVTISAASRRDMQFVLHEVLNVVDELKVMPQHADIDVDTFNAVLEEGGKFASEVIFPINLSGDAEGCTWTRRRTK